MEPSATPSPAQHTPISTIADKRAAAEERKRRLALAALSTAAAPTRSSSTNSPIIIAPVAPVATTVAPAAANAMDPSLLITQSQINAMNSDAATAILNAAEKAKADADAAKAANDRAAGLLAINTTLPSSFLAMEHTKQQYSRAISLYHTQHKALLAARNDLERFNASCNKRSPLISLPQSLRGNYSKALFIAVDGDAAFYKTTMDALKTLEQESTKQAFTLIVEGKKRYINHLESFVKTQSFVTQALETHSSFVTEINRLYAQRGSSMTIPLDAARLHFETKLRKEMELYDSQQIQAALAANQKKKESTEQEMKAEEQIIDGSHNGANIAQIATKAVKSELVQTKKELAVANNNISHLQEQINRLAGAKVTATIRPPLLTAKSKVENSKKRKAELTPRSKSPAPVNTEDMSDEPVPDASLKPSNSRGGGRPHNQSKSKSKKQKVDRKEGDKSVVQNPKQRIPK